MYKKHTKKQFKTDPVEFEPIKNIEVITALRDYARKLYEQDIINYNTCNNLKKNSTVNF